jgi:2,4-dienoyl-CoA reductase (NADPH2)
VNVCGDAVSAGWIHRSSLARRDVTQLGKCKYLEVTDEGLVIERDGKKETLVVRNIELRF